MGEPFWYTLALIITFTSILLLKFTVAKIRQNHDKNLPPSPPSLPIIGHLHLLKEPIHRTLQSLSSNLGKILFLRWGSRRVLLISSPSIAEECYTKHDIILSNRPRLLAGKHFHYNFKTVAAAPYGDLWRNLRRVMTLEIFSSSRLATSSSVRQAEVRLLLNQTTKSCACTQQGMTKIELKSKFMELSFNVMTMMVLGKRYHGEDVEDVEEAKHFREVMRDAVDLSATTNLGDFLPILQWMDISGLEKKMARLMAKMDSFLQSLVEERRRILSPNLAANGKDDNTFMIDNLLSMQETEPEFYTDEIIKGIILVTHTSL
ncbi:unnamed protein product [Prunus brigantina]